MTEMVYLNGEYLTADQAKISVLDRGFLFGDGVYEVVPIYNGKFFGLEEHLARLQRSLESIRLNIDYDLVKWQHIFQSLLECNPTSPNQAIYLQVTRGVAAMRDHVFDDDLTPTIYANIFNISQETLEKIAAGISVITCEDERWQRCDIKAITLLPNILAKKAAKDVGASEAILINDDFAIEGCSSNLFIVKDNTVVTTPLSNHLLAGITRKTVIGLIQETNLKLEERMITETELFAADEVWLTSSTREIMPVTMINQTMVNLGEPGPIWQKIHTAYQIAKLK